ncbi:MAG TPA: MarR family transcriptional regulator [Kribbellaceae bacterium]|nr:MarR family transcriptional regulator [Kribbellaceae bacterium]
MDADEVIRLRRVIGRLARMLNASASTEDLTPTQASVLGLVVGRGPIGLAELAELEGLNKTMLSRVVTALDGAGLVRRLADPADQRAVRLEATAPGRRAMTRIVKRRTETVTAIVAGLPDEDTAKLLDALPALEALAEGLRGSTPRR